MTINDLVVEFAASQRSDQPGEPKTTDDPVPLADYKEAFDDSETQLDAWARWAASLLGENLRSLRSDPARRRLRLDRDVELRKRVSKMQQNYSAASSTEIGRMFAEAWNEKVRPSTTTPTINDLVVEACARVGHEVYRAALGVSDMRAWDTAPEDDKAQARAATKEALSADVSKTTPAQWHAKWCAEKAADGWKYGPVIDVERKQHPNMLPYEQLPEEQRALDQLFVVAVESTRAAIDALEVAYSVPVFKVKGDIPPEQYEKFRCDYAQQLASSPNMWKTPIVDMETKVADHLVPLFEKHCECRPTNTTRFSHSHDCDTEVTDDVRTVLHRVVLAGPDADMYGQRDDHRAATDEEVRAARLRLAELLSKESK